MSRRGNGDGTVYKRRRGAHESWVAQIYVRTPEGGRRRKTIAAPTRAEAHKLLEQVRRQQAAGLATPLRRCPTIADYGARWLTGTLRDEVRMGHLSQATYESYELTMRLHIVPALGTWRLDQLTAAPVRQWLSGMLDEVSARGTRYSPRTVAIAHAVLRRALNDAVRDELIAQNVMERVRPPRGRPTEPIPFTVQELQRLISETRQAELKPLWVVLVMTGLRAGEALALRWSDIDLDAGTLTVKRAVSRRRVLDAETGASRTRLVESTPKTQKSQATLAVPALALDALRLHRGAQVRNRVAAPVWVNPDLVFTTSVGTHLEHGRVLSEFKAAALRSGITRNVRVHDLRHTTATLLLREGVSLRVVQEALRHTRLSTTADIYMHVQDDVKRTAAHVLDRVMTSGDAAFTRGHD